MAAPWSTPVGCRSGHEGPLRVDSRGSIAVPRTAAIWRKPGVRDDRSELLNRVMGWTPPDGICVPR